MLYLVLGIIALGFVVALMSFFTRNKNGESDVIVTGSGDCSTCTGVDESCMHDCLLDASTKEIEYYDDEELDAFIGRESDQYTDEEVEQFSEVLYTMKPEDVKGWNISLTLRNINLPNQIKDEVIMMLEG